MKITLNKLFKIKSKYAPLKAYKSSLLNTQMPISLKGRSIQYPNGDLFIILSELAR